MENRAINISLSKVSIIAGIAILIMAFVAPYAELFVYPKLVNPISPAETFSNITSNKSLFIAAIFCYLLTFIGDILVSWALYILLKPVNQPLSLLTAWFRLVFSIIAIVALLNLVVVFQLMATHDYLTMPGQTQFYGQVMLYFKAFKSSYHFGILFFSIHLVLLGYLVYKSGYIPKWIGVVLIISGLGYLTDALKPFLFPDLNSGFLTITFFGELIFMFWLLIKGSRIKDPN